MLTKLLYNIRLFFAALILCVSHPTLLILSVTQRESLNDPRIGFAAFAELVKRQFVVVVLVHLAEDLVHPSLWSVFILRIGSLTL